MAKKVLITGANGLLGSAVAARFVAAGDEVFALCRKSADLSLLEKIKDKISIVEGDVLDIFSLEKAIEKVEYVVHTAAVVSFAPKDRDIMYKVNVEGTANVVNVCLSLSINKLCFVSSIAALGRPSNHHKTDDIKVIDETQKWEDSPLNAHYAITKYQAENEVWRGEAEGLKMVVVNPSIIIGEGDWHKSSTKLFKYVYDKNKFYTEGCINYVDLLDVAEAIYRLIDSDISGERYILNAGTTTYKDFFEKIAKGFHISPPSKSIKPWLANIIWRAEALRAFITGSTPLITKETTKNSRTKFAYNNEKVIKNLNMQFRTLDESITRICQYLAQEKR